jgi:cytoskeleton protein RodZ
VSRGPPAGNRGAASQHSPLLKSAAQALNCLRMVSLTKITSRDFGEALRAAREKAGVTIEAISGRTKISVRQLAALESGDFGQLPNQVFAKMFLHQYLDLIQAEPENWLHAFDAAWRKFAESSQSFVVGPVVPVRRRRAGPWIVSLVLVAAAVTGVLLVERRQHVTGGLSLVRAPEQRAPAGTTAGRAAAPVSPTPTVAAEHTPQPGVLFIRTGGTSCWAEVHVSGERPSSRLLASSAVWEVAAGGREVDLVLGDAGAVSIEYLGEFRSPVGRPGEVAHIHLQASPTPSVQP